MGKELNPESYDICKADMLIKGQDIANIIFGNTLSADGLPGRHFDDMLSNPPFGVEWKKIESSRHIPCAVSPNSNAADGTRSDACHEVPISRIFKNEDFDYMTITVERPERDSAGNIVTATKGKLKGKPQPDSNLRDTENVPLSKDVETYFEREVLPHAPDAWIDHEKTKIGYEIPFNRHFYVFKPPRELAEIDAELKVVTDRILTMIGRLSK